MYPTGSFKRFRADLLETYKDYGKDEYVTFGILIADYRQTDAREYIYNYIDLFDKESGRYFDFFIPGYGELNYVGDARKCFTIREKDYYFSERLFKDFCAQLSIYFDIKYSFNPMLILMAMIPNKIHTAKCIAIYLDDDKNYGVKRSGVLFRKIFSFAVHDPTIEGFESFFRKTYIMGDCIDSILNLFGKGSLVELKNYSRKYRCYKIKDLRL